MEHRKLGKTGIAVPLLTIGGWQIGGPLVLDGKADGHPDIGEESAIRILRELGDLGVRAVDTAEQYGDGESERRIGIALKGQRDRWVISTKFGCRVGPGQTRDDDGSPPTILRSLEGSLQRLQTDFIDIFLYHSEPQVSDLDQAREILEKAKRDGKIRAYGISTNNTALLREMVQRQAVEIVQFSTNLISPAEELRAFATEACLGTQVRGVMAQGRLSGKYFRCPPELRPDDIRRNWFSAADYEGYAVLESSVPEGYTMAQAALRWALDQPGQHTVCLGAKNLDDWHTAIEAVSLPPLPPDAARALCAAAAARQP